MRSANMARSQLISPTSDATFSILWEASRMHTRAATNSWHANQRLLPFRSLHDCSDCFRLERSPGGPFTHWKTPPSHGAHPTGHLSPLSKVSVNGGLRQVLHFARYH